MNSCKTLSSVFAGLASILGLIALAGWVSEIELLKSGVIGAVAMNPTTAVAFILSAVSLWLLQTPGTLNANSARLAGAMVAAIGGIKLADYLLGIELGIDRFLFADQLAGNCMAPNTAAGFTVMGAALVLADARQRLWFFPGEVLAACASVLGLLGLLGYLFSARALYEVESYIPMALNTALAFELMGIGILCSRPNRGLMAALASRNAGGAAARHLLPVAAILPVIIGLMRIKGEYAGLYNTEFGVALMVTTTVVLFVSAVCWTAISLNKTDHERHRAVEDLRSAHLELRSQTEILQSILNSMGDGVVVANKHGQFMQFNPAAERILGMSPYEVAPNSWTDKYGCYLADGVTPYPAVELPLARALRGESVAEEELFIRNTERQEGTWISITGQPLRAANGGLQGGVVVFRDVSERRRAVQALRNSREELERRVTERTKELAQANRDLSEKNQENEMFVYSVSHDLRSPLVNLQGFSKELDVVAKDLKGLLTSEVVPEVIRKEATALLDGEVQQSLQFIQIAVSRLGNIIDALLRLSRVGKIEYQCRPCDLQSLVRRVVESMSAGLYDADATVSLGELPPCCGDETALEQLFANLIGNALKYRDSSRPSTIEVGAVAEQSISGEATGTYYVRDNGLGIPIAHQEKIFQAFKRAHPNVASGEGMGLAIVRRIVERHGGSVRVESKVGQGSTFFVTLPILASEFAVESRESDALQGETKHGRRTNGDFVGGRR